MNDGLTEFVDAEFFISGAPSPAEEEKLIFMLRDIPGIAESIVAHGRADVHYDPTTVTKQEIGEKIKAAGFQITSVEAASSSPIVDATTPNSDQSSQTES